MEWTVEVLNETVSKELDALSADIRARFVRICELLERAGPRRVGGPYVRHLTGPLWEIRMGGRDKIARAMYVTGRGKRVIVVRVFIKKTQKTPRREIDLALQRAKEILK